MVVYKIIPPIYFPPIVHRSDRCYLGNVQAGVLFMTVATAIKLPDKLKARIARLARELVVRRIA